MLLVLPLGGCASPLDFGALRSPPEERCLETAPPRVPRVIVELEPEGVSGVSAGLPGPRASTPGGVAAGLHGTPVAGGPAPGAALVGGFEGAAPGAVTAPVGR